MSKRPTNYHTYVHKPNTFLIGKPNIESYHITVILNKSVQCWEFAASTYRSFIFVSRKDHMVI